MDLPPPPPPAGVRNLILDLLRQTDEIQSLTKRKVRTELEAIQESQKATPPADASRQIPADYDLIANKKAVNDLIQECTNEVAGPSNGVKEEPADVKPSLVDSTPSSQSASVTPGLARSPPPPPRTTIPIGGGLALPGLGGVRGSHASPPPPAAANGSSHRPSADTSGDAALAAKLARESAAADSPATRGSSTSSSSGTRPSAKRKSKANADEIESDEDSEVESNAAPVKKAAKRTKKATSEKKPRAANPNNPFNRPVLLSPAMAEICGGTEMPRHGVVKQLWAYVKERELQNPSNKRQIMCDEKLSALFGKPMVDSFEMSKLIGSHLKKKEDVVS